MATQGFFSPGKKRMAGEKDNNPFLSVKVDSVKVANNLNQYSVTITDSANCSEVFPFNISEPALFTISAVVSSTPWYNGADVSCNGASDGEITIVSSGGNGVSYYNVAGNTLLGGSNVQGGLPAGTYSIDAYDINITEFVKNRFKTFFNIVIS